MLEGRYCTLYLIALILDTCELSDPNMSTPIGFSSPLLHVYSECQRPVGWWMEWLRSLIGGTSYKLHGGPDPYCAEDACDMYAWTCASSDTRIFREKRYHHHHQQLRV